jgi:hypothetical protein
MASIIVKNNIPADLKPMIDEWTGEYNLVPQQWEQIFKSYSSDQAFEKDGLLSDFTYVPQKPEAQAVSYSDFSQQFTTTYNHVSYGLGFQVSREAQDDFQTLNVVERGIKGLFNATTRTYETLGANVLNNGFDNTYPGGDGASLFSTSHPTLAGNQSNVLATPAAFSEAALEQLLIQIAQAKNHTGTFIGLQGEKLIIPPSLMFDAQRITKSILQAETANNSLNAMRSMGMFPGGVHTDQYLTDSGAYYIITNAQDGLKYFSRTAPEISRDQAFDQEVLKVKIFFRCSFYWTDFRGAYASYAPA